MKTSIKFIALAISTLFFLNSCEKSELSQSNSISDDNLEIKKLDNATAAPSSNCIVYSLILGGSTGTPHAAGLDSYIAPVDVCTGVTLGAVQIMAGAVAVKSVTGLTKSHFAGEFYAVTGANSNFPNKIMRVNAAGSVISMINAWFGSPNQIVPIQDIEWKAAGALEYFAIKEGSNTIFKVNVVTGQLSIFNSTIPTAQLNGLTFDSLGRMWVISGQTNANCATGFGDMWALNAAGTVVLTRTYNNLPANPTWVGQELGLHFDTCCVKRFVVGSSSMVMSNNTNNLCGGLTPTFINNVKPTYDYARQ
jgi:hypothetical protein